MDDIERFNPQMLTLARQTRGWSQVQTAKRSEVAQSLVSKYESGTMLPRDGHIERLAAALDYPETFFHQQFVVTGPGIGEIFHRKRVKTAAKTLGRFHAVAEVRRFETAKLLNSWPVTEPAVPFLSIDEYDDDPAAIAQLMRSFWNLPSGPLFNLTETMELNGCVIYSHDFGTAYIDGFSHRIAGDPPLFHVNAAMPPDRWRWTLAHELGHMVMHGFGEVEPDTAEQQANRFAGEFLAPAAELQPSLWNLDFRRLAGLKREWKISMQAIIMRARDLEVITERQRRDLFARLGKAGHRTREPASLDPPIERETKVRQLAQYHVNNLGYTRGELLDYLRIGERDFDQYYGSTGDRLLDAALEGEPRTMEGIDITLGPDAPRLHAQLGCAEAEVTDYQDILDALYFRLSARILDEAQYRDAVSGVMNRLGLKIKSLRDARKPLGSDGELNLVFGLNAPPLHVQLGCHPEDVANYQRELDRIYKQDGPDWQRHADESRRQEIVVALTRKIRAMEEHNRRLERMWDS